MNKEPLSDIQILDGQVVDQIAAGEVIERPAQLLKELVENSLDASSSKIIVSVTSDLSFIAVEDDGLGIKKSDLSKVFLRHSTSKLRKTEDLLELSSFGFRGEALSAIGSVSKAQIETRHEKEPTGHLFVYENGKEVLCEENQKDRGTKITITHLFDSTPARKKFLKSKRHELSLVKKVLNSFSLRHYDKEFKFILDGKLSFFYSPVKSLEERYSQVNKNKKVFRLELPECDVLQKGSSVYLEEPSIESKTGQGLWTFIQERSVFDKTIAAAVRDGLNTYLMHGTFPRGVVDLKVRKDFVDVNVHPMKSEVRFENSSYIYKSIRKAVSDWAYNAPWKVDVIRPSKATLESFVEPRQNLNSLSSDSFFVEEALQTQPSMSLGEPQVLYKKTVGNLNSDLVTKNLLKKDDAFEPYWSSLMVIGQVNLTYIVAQSNEAVFFIDQHAAHERVAFERLKKQWSEKKDKDVQSLLLPLYMDIDESNLEALLVLKEELFSIGVEIEAAGPESLALNALPSYLKEESVEKGLRQLAKDRLNQGGGSSLDEVFELFFATLACHSVIRAGHAMSNDEMKLLLLEMDKYKSRYCPHGRPVYKKISFQSLDQDFGRVV